MEICGRRWLLLWFLRLLTGLNPSLTKVVPWQILVWNFLRDLIFPSRRLTIALRIMCSVSNVWIRHWGSLGISLSKVACTSWLAFPTNIPNRWLLHQHPVYGYVSFFSISLQQGSFSEPQHRLLIPEALRMELWIQSSYKCLATMSPESICMVYLMLYSRFNLHCYQHLFILLSHPSWTVRNVAHIHFPINFNIMHATHICEIWVDRVRFSESVPHL